MLTEWGCLLQPVVSMCLLQNCTSTAVIWKSDWWNYKSILTIHGLDYLFWHIWSHPLRPSSKKFWRHIDSLLQVLFTCSSVKHKACIKKSILIQTIWSWKCLKCAELNLFPILLTVEWSGVAQVLHMWPNPTKPGTSRKTCFWVNSHKRWLAQNYFQFFKFVFSCLLSGNNISFQMPEESIQMRFFFKQ